MATVPGGTGGGGSAGGKSGGLPPGLLLVGEPRPDIDRQGWLVVLHREDVVAAGRKDRRADVTLAKQRVAGNDVAPDREQAQQLEGGLVLVGLGIDAHLDEREHLRQRPPHLLLTNYQMLEYLLVRPQDRDSLFAGHRCWFVVLDEVHTYRGTLGTHVALLMRRLRAHLRRANPQTPAFVPIATSATIRSDREVKPGAALDPAERDQAVQQFFGKLVGVEPATVKVVGESSEVLSESGVKL